MRTDQKIAAAALILEKKLAMVSAFHRCFVTYNIKRLHQKRGILEFLVHKRSNALTDFNVYLFIVGKMASVSLKKKLREMKNKMENFLIKIQQAQT